MFGILRRLPQPRDELLRPKKPLRIRSAAADGRTPVSVLSALRAGLAKLQATPRHKHI